MYYLLYYQYNRITNANDVMHMHHQCIIFFIY